MKSNNQLANNHNPQTIIPWWAMQSFVSCSSTSWWPCFELRSRCYSWRRHCSCLSSLSGPRQTLPLALRPAEQHSCSSCLAWHSSAPCYFCHSMASSNDSPLFQIVAKGNTLNAIAEGCAHTHKLIHNFNPTDPPDCCATVWTSYPLGGAYLSV